jgi:hypothetical protein
MCTRVKTKDQTFRIALAQTLPVCTTPSCTPRIPVQTSRGHGTSHLRRSCLAVANPHRRRTCLFPDENCIICARSPSRIKPCSRLVARSTSDARGKSRSAMAARTYGYDQHRRRRRDSAATRDSDVTEDPGVDRSATPRAAAARTPRRERTGRTNTPASPVHERPASVFPACSRETARTCGADAGCTAPSQRRGTARNLVGRNQHQLEGESSTRACARDRNRLDQALEVLGCGLATLPAT